MNTKVLCCCCSNWFRRAFHYLSNVRPLVWMAMFILMVPIFALIYWLMPDGMFIHPEGPPTNFGDWMYYSVVTITTLGFGDFSPLHPLAKALTAIEVMSGLMVCGFFLNAVGAMKSEIVVASQIEKDRKLNEARQKERLQMRTPGVLRVLHAFINHCRDVQKATPARRADEISDLMKSALRCTLALDSLQSHVDLSLWPDIMEASFKFVASYQLLSSEMVTQKGLEPVGSADINPGLMSFMENNCIYATKIINLLLKNTIPQDEQNDDTTASSNG